MRQRGRSSVASLSLVSSVSQVERVDRPRPLPGMPEAQAAVWLATVNSLAADWFRPEQLPLLAQYCRHVVAANVLAEEIEATQSALAHPELERGTRARALIAQEYTALLAAQRNESAAIVQLATKMRISHQATYDKSKTKPAVGKRPWE